MIDNDLPFTPRLITDEEADNFPKHAQPKVPTKEDDVEKVKKIDEEKTHGHPAFATRDKYRERGEKVD